MTRIRAGLSKSFAALLAAVVLMPLAAPPVSACLSGAPAPSCCCAPGDRASSRSAPAATETADPERRSGSSSSTERRGGCCEIRRAPAPVRAAAVQVYPTEGRPDQPTLLPVAAPPSLVRASLAGDPFAPGGSPPHGGDPPDLLRLNCLLLI